MTPMQKPAAKAKHDHLLDAPDQSSFKGTATEMDSKAGNTKLEPMKKADRAERRERNARESQSQ